MKALKKWLRGLGTSALTLLVLGGGANAAFAYPAGPDHMSTGGTYDFGGAVTTSTQPAAQPSDPSLLWLWITIAVVSVALVGLTVKLTAGLRHRRAAAAA